MAADYRIEWRGSGQQEIGVDAASGKTLVQVSPTFYRPSEVQLLIGDPGKAKAQLDWSASTTLEELCQMMVQADLRRNAIGATF